MPDKGWKAAERRIAAMMGGKRVPVTGRGRGDRPDVDHPDFSIEVKHWSRLPARVLDAIAQADAAAQPGQTPLAIIHGRGTPYGQSLAVIRLEDLLERLRSPDQVEVGGPGRA